MANKYKMIDDKLVQLTDEEQKEFESRDFSDAKKLSMLRNERDRLLKQSDWVVIKEKEESNSVSNFSDWKTYRQELRDITKTFKSLHDKDFKFPEKPKG